MSSLGRWCFRKRRLVVLAWAMALVALAVATQVQGATFRNDFRVADSESQRAIDLMQERFPEFAGDPLAVAFRAEPSIDDAEVRAAMEAFFAAVTARDGVRDVVSPYTGLAPVTADRTTAIAQVRLEDFGPEADPDLVRGIIEDAEELSRRADLQVDVGGPTAMFAEMEPPGEREAAGVVVALGVLVLTFGSLLAAGLPIAVALGGLGAGMGLVVLLTRVMEVFTFAPAMAAMIGLGVGIDYALFIVTRYRQELRAGLGPADACARATSTAGRAVVFAGATVVVSLLGMVLMGVSMVVGMAVSAALVVSCTVVAALTLLPAMLGFIGPSIDRFAVGRTRRVEEVAADGRWYRWSRSVQAHPWPAMAVALAVLLGLSAPVLGMELGGPHFGGGPETQSSRRAYDLVSDAFGEGFNGPLLLVAELPGGPAAAGDALDRLVRGLQGTDGVALVAPPIPNEAGDTAVVMVVPDSAPHSTATQDLVKRLRDDVVPAAVDGSDVVVSVSGVTALFADMADLFSRRLPLFIGAVITTSFLLLMAVFRSLLVPLKAAVMNLLSIGAAYGVVVAVFQWGWGASLIGVDRPAPIMAFVPMMLFAILFGLSMDYEVFLLSRIREEYDRSGDNATAVADGLAGTARVITAAAAIMVIIFGSFVLGDDPFVKMFGLGLAVAVLVDATVVRMVLVPATMELLGDANWWLPRWLDRLLPALDLEGAGAAVDPAVQAGAAPAAGVVRPVHVRAGVVAWLESLTDDERGRAAAHVEHALAAGAVMAADRDGSSEVVVPLGRRTRRLLLTSDVEGYALDVRAGRRSEAEGDWPDVRDQLLQSMSARTSYRQVRGTAEVATHLRSLRQARQLSTADVAERAGTTVDVVDRLERGDGSVEVIDLIGVGRVLDARIDLTGDDIDHRDTGGRSPSPPIPERAVTRRHAGRPPHHEVHA